MKKRNIVFTLIALSAFALFCFSIWLGWDERRELSKIGSESTDGAESMLKKYQAKLKKQPDSDFIKYNLAYFHFRQKNYEESGNFFEELINGGKPDKDIVRKTFYNLGNAHFRLADKEKDLAQTVALLKKSLEYYRTAIEMQKQGGKYFNLKKGKSDDARFNYAVARKRLKLLEDGLEKQKRNQERQKRLYQLLTELFAQESEIKKRLAALKNKPISRELLKERDQLLILRGHNLKKLKIIQEKVNQRVND